VAEMLGTAPAIRSRPRSRCTGRCRRPAADELSFGL